MKKLLFWLVVIVVVFGLGITLYTKYQKQETNEPSHEDLVHAITDRFPGFLHEGTPVIEIADVRRLEDSWYVVTIKSIHEEGAPVPVKVILISSKSSDKEKNLDLILGPDTYFTETELLNYNVPDSVILELEKS